MKQLLIEEMKRAIQIMESKEELTITNRVYYGKDKEHSYTTVNRETSELRQLLLAIRKHSILLEKGIK